MAHNKLYRNFIILQADEKSLSGYAKIEAKGDKCKISFYAQNLDKDQKYLMLLICYKKDMKQIVDLGPLLIKEEGKGEAVKEYYVNNIAGLDMSYDKISGAAICKTDDDKFNFIMYGFMNGENVKDDWKKSKIIKHSECEEVKNKDKKDKEEIKDKQEHKEKEAIKYKHEHEEHEKHDKHESYKEKKEMKHDHECEEYDKHEGHDKHEGYKEKKEIKHEHGCEEKEELKHKAKIEEKEPIIEVEVIKEVGKLEHDKVESCKSSDLCDYKEREDNESSEKDSIITDFDEYETRIEREKDINPYDFQLRGGVGEYFGEVAKGFEEIKNRFKDIKYCKWYRVNVNDIEDLCNTSNYNRYTIAYNPMLNYYPYIKNQNHFVLGYKCDNRGELKYLVYGIPGRKNIDEQPYMGKTGFVTWMRSSDNTDNEDEMGYWLMFYDYKNSVVVVPMR